jgi:hypothetical protein
MVQHVKSAAEASDNGDEFSSVTPLEFLFEIVSFLVIQMFFRSSREQQTEQEEAG